VELNIFDPPTFLFNFPSFPKPHIHSEKLSPGGKGREASKEEDFDKRDILRESKGETRPSKE